MIDTLKAIRAEDTRPRTKLDEEIEAFAPFGKSITSRQELRDLVFSFSPIAEKLGFKINAKRSGHEARFSSNNNAVEIVFQSCIEEYQKLWICRLEAEGQALVLLMP